MKGQGFIGGQNVIETCLQNPQGSRDRRNVPKFKSIRLVNRPISVGIEVVTK